MDFDDICYSIPNLLAENRGEQIKGSVEMLLL